MLLYDGLPTELALYGTVMPQRCVDAAGNEFTLAYGTVQTQSDSAAVQLQAQAAQMQATAAATLVQTTGNTNNTGTWSRKEAPKVNYTFEFVHDATQ